MLSFIPSSILMRAATEMARESRGAGYYAVGSIVAQDGRIISKVGKRTRPSQCSFKKFRITW
jgi:hypothetical protein